MAGYEKTTNALTSFAIYCLGIIVVMVAGFKVIDHSNRLKFYNRFLNGWEQGLTRFSAIDVVLPQFTGANHTAYMDELVNAMKSHGIPIPPSNTTKPYVYRIPKVGVPGQEDIFLLGFERKIVLFGLSKKSANMLDKLIDGQTDLTKGNFKGKPQNNNADYTGIWNI